MVASQLFVSRATPVGAMGWPGGQGGWWEGGGSWQGLRGGWQGHGGSSSSGGAGTGRWRAAPRGPTPDPSAVAPEEVVYNTWPVTRSAFPSVGDLSFDKLVADADDMGCSVRIRSHKDARRQGRANVLTVKGPSCWEVYRVFLTAARTFGLRPEQGAPT